MEHIGPSHFNTGPKRESLTIKASKVMFLNSKIHNPN